MSLRILAIALPVLYPTKRPLKKHKTRIIRLEGSNGETLHGDT